MWMDHAIIIPEPVQTAIRQAREKGHSICSPAGTVEIPFRKLGWALMGDCGNGSCVEHEGQQGTN